MNLAGNAFSLKTCHLLSSYIIYSGGALLDLNLSHCHISYQGTRYIIDALNRNTVLRFFNFSSNDMCSSSYEFSIKLGAIITRHPNLMHIDISNVGLKREEVLFMGLALYMSKTMVALHMSGNTLPYYDRIFLRTLASAKVSWKFKNDASVANKIKNNKEFTQIMHLGSGKNYNPKLEQYIRNYNDLDVEREGLEFNIEEMLHDLDTDTEFRDLKENWSQKDIPKGSKLDLLIGKIKARNMALGDQRKTL